jgi:hypothetical protein
MKEITHGLQYKVYEYNKKQYLKKPTSLNFKMKVLSSWWPEIVMPKKKKIAFAKGAKKIMIDSLNFFKKNKKRIDMSLIGNPIFLKNHSYIQDKVATIRDYIKTHNHKENCRVIDKYVSLLIETCKYGFCEVVFNLTINCGVTKNKKVILFDFTEITTDLEKVFKMIENKKWLKQHSYKWHLSYKLKKYFKNTMEKKFTKSKVKKVWGKNLGYKKTFILSFT